MQEQESKYVGKTYIHPVYGEYTVIRDLGVIKKFASGSKQRILEIQFKNTGFILQTYPSSVVRKQVRDPYCPTVAGVGYFGEPKNYDSSNEVDKRIHILWTNMIKRCNSETATGYCNYGGAGVTVDPRWHSFANFFEDFKKMENYDKWAIPNSGYQLDKDSLQIGIPTNQKVYSKDTCKLIHSSTNVIISQMELNHLSDITYIGVYCKGRNIYASQFNKSYKNSESVKLNAKFSDPLSAAVYRDTYCQFYNGFHPNNVPIDPISVRSAQDNRLDKEYTQLYHLINKEETK